MKFLIYLVIIICLAITVNALTMDNLRTITNQYTQKPDWIRTGNWTGENITADNIFGYLDNWTEQATENRSGDVTFGKNIILDVGSFIGSGLRTPNMSGGYGIPVGTLSLVGGSKTTHYGGIGGGGGKISLQGGRGRDASNDPSSYAPILLQSNGGNVGIGTTSPDRLFEIFGSASVFRFRDSGATASSTTAFIEFGGTDGGNWNRTGYIGDGASGNTDLYFQAEEGDLRLGDSSGNSVLTLSEGDATFGGDTIHEGTTNLSGNTLVEGNLNVTGNITSDYFKGNIDWTNLTNYPVACPTDSVIEQLGDSVTCVDIHSILATNRSENVAFGGNISIPTDKCYGFTGRERERMCYSTNNINTYAQTAIVFTAGSSTQFRHPTYTGFVTFSGTSSGRLAFHTATYPNYFLMWGRGGKSMFFGLRSTIRRSLIIGDYDSRDQIYDHPAQDNPTLYLQSATLPNDDNTQWLSLTHNKSNAVYESGNGSHYFRNNVDVQGNFTVGNLLEIKNDAIDSTYTRIESPVGQKFFIGNSNIFNVLSTGATLSVGDFTASNGWIQSRRDNEGYYTGAGGDTRWYYNASDSIFDPDIVGSGSVWIGATGDDDIYFNNAKGFGNITSENVFVPQYIFSHTNRTQSLVAVNVWTNVTFDQDVSTDIKFGINHSTTDDTNDTFTIMEDGIYEVDYDFDVEDNSGTPSDIDVAGRIVLVNGTEVVGSVFETDIAKQGISTELSHDFLIRCLAGEQFKFQFVADNADVIISTHGTFGDHPESATIVIKKVANL